MQPIEKRNRQPAQESTNNEFLDDDVAVDGDDGSDEREQTLMFIDFENTLDDGQHIPNLCVVQNESGDEMVFSGLNTKEESATGFSRRKTPTPPSWLIIFKPTTGISSCNTFTIMV
jgi:hypothetical protein